MVLFNDANQARLALKMQMSRYPWFRGSFVQSENDEYVVVIQVAAKDDVVRKTVPVVHNGVEIRTDIVRGAR
jgi:hypothetical protein